MDYHQFLHKNRISFDVNQVIVCEHSQIVRDNGHKVIGWQKLKPDQTRTLDNFISGFYLNGINALLDWWKVDGHLYTIDIQSFWIDADTGKIVESDDDWSL